MSGWGAAASYQRQRLEDEERRRVAQWEAQQQMQMPPPSGVKRCLERSFPNALARQAQTHSTGSMDYQGVQCAQPLYVAFPV